MSTTSQHTSGETLVRLPEGLGPGRALERLTRRFTARESDLEEGRATFYDTFDWRLHRAGVTLTARAHDGGTELEWSSATGQPPPRLRTARLPLFAGEFPDGAWRSSLTPLIRMRRLLPRLELRRRSRELAILDKRQKTVARVRLEERWAAAPGDGPERPLPTVLRIVPVRGYTGARRRLLEAALEAGGEIEPDELKAALAAIGRRAGDYTSRIRVQLEPDATAFDGTRAVLADLFETLQANEEGTRLDLDSEFLHDFRVAVRRTRSALGQIKGAFDGERIAPFRKELSWLGQLTGPTRDLDVYLLKLPGYRSLLPEDVRGALDPLHEFLARHQAIEQRKLAAGLQSARYRRLVERWRKLVAGVDADRGERADEPMAEVASRCIRRAHKRVIKRGAAIGDDSPAGKLHRLRIDCKKLRYLLEFFRSLYPFAGIGDLVKALKRLQDNLGDFNDYGVQLKMLPRFARQMIDEGVAGVETTMTIGRLVERLEHGKAEERRRFAERFAAFSAKDTVAAFRRL